MPTNKSQRTVYIDDDLWERFCAAAKREHRAANNMLVVLIDDFVKTQGSADDKVQTQRSA